LEVFKFGSVSEATGFGGLEIAGKDILRCDKGVGIQNLISDSEGLGFERFTSVQDFKSGLIDLDSSLGFRSDFCASDLFSVGLDETSGNLHFAKLTRFKEFSFAFSITWSCNFGSEFFGVRVPFKDPGFCESKNALNNILKIQISNP